MDKEIAIARPRNVVLHAHVCLACGVEFNCPTSRYCTAGINVLPMLYMQITEGKYAVVRHCGETTLPSFPIAIVANDRVPVDSFRFIN